MVGKHAIAFSDQKLVVHKKLFPVCSLCLPESNHHCKNFLNWVGSFGEAAGAGVPDLEAVSTCDGIGGREPGAVLPA